MIEYHTVKTPAPSCKWQPTRTVRDYRAELKARFGRVPSYQELARIEQGQPPTMRQYVPPAPDNPNMIAAKAAIIAKGIATRADIMAVLTKPMTCPAIAEALNRTRQLINRHLVILKAEGKVTLRKVKGFAVWEAVE
jgi:hypothetical protein